MDVDLSVTRNKDRYYCFSISERALRLMRQPEYLIAGVCGDRLYLKPTDAREGYRVAGARRQHSTRYYFRFPERLGAGTEHEIIGDYELRWDGECNLAYIKLGGRA